MKKIIPIKYQKIWGYEIWVHSPLQGKATRDLDGNKTKEGPLLKIIKTISPLSVQVHPDDQIAKKLENATNGKSESWYILQTGKNAELVLGLKIFDPKIIRASLQKRDFLPLLKKVKPQVGGFYNIPAGLVHGLGKNITVFELQQASDITYRYYDYDRRDSTGNYRELHIEKALQSQKDLSYKLKPVSTKPLIFKNQVATQEFYNKPVILKQNALVVDFNDFVCYKARQGELINLQNYAVIHSFQN